MASSQAIIEIISKKAQRLSMSFDQVAAATPGFESFVGQGPVVEVKVPQPVDSVIVTPTKSKRGRKTIYTEAFIKELICKALSRGINHLRVTDFKKLGKEYAGAYIAWSKTPHNTGNGSWKEYVKTVTGVQL